MAVTKRVRYEVLRRDNFACRYCGGSAPEVVLTVDHVIPVALGGSDDPTNLVAACSDCNAGKTSVAPDSPIVADANMQAAAWSRAMEQAAAERAADHDRMRALTDEFREKWDAWKWTDKLGKHHQISIAGNWRSSVEQFLAAGLPLSELIALIEVAMGAKTTDEWRYFCGCAWRRVREAQERAAEILRGDRAVE